MSAPIKYFESLHKICEYFLQRAFDLRRLSLGSAFLGSFFSLGHTDEYLQPTATPNPLKPELQGSDQVDQPFSFACPSFSSESPTSRENPSVPGKPGWLVILLWAVREGIEWCGLHNHTCCVVVWAALPAFLAQSGTS